MTARALFLAVALGAAAPAILASDSAPETETTPSLTLVQSAILGLVEGVTEYLPVSSTGHLKIVQHAMGLEETEEAKVLADAYAIVIQAGAILAVLGMYAGWVLRMLRGLAGRDEEGLRLVRNLAASFLPAAVIGLALNEPIKRALFHPWPVVAAWAVGGVGLLGIESWRRRRDPGQGLAMTDLSVRGALLIGLLQCVAMWPGTSRSLMAIVGGLLLGMRLREAVVYSFLLGLVTLGAATAYDTLKHGEALLGAYGPAPLAVGFLAATVSAAVTVRWMLSYLNRHGLGLFGWYRIGLAAAVAVWLLAGDLRF